MRELSTSQGRLMPPGEGAPAVTLTLGSVQRHSLNSVDLNPAEILHLFTMCQEADSQPSRRFNIEMSLVIDVLFL